MEIRWNPCPFLIRNSRHSTRFLESGRAVASFVLYGNLFVRLLSILALFFSVPTLHSLVTLTSIVYRLAFLLFFLWRKINLGLVVPSTNFPYSFSQTFPFFFTHDDFSFDPSSRRSQLRVLYSGQRQLLLLLLLTLRTIQRSYSFLSSFSIFVCYIVWDCKSSFSFFLYSHSSLACVSFVLVLISSFKNPVHVICVK